MARIGLVAGEGKLPIVFSRVAKVKGDTVIAFALKGVTSPELEKTVEKLHWIPWGSLQKGLLLLATERIRKIVMLGKIKKDILFKDEGALDDHAKKMLGKLKDRKDYAILNEINKAFSKLGIEVLDSTTYLKDLIPSRGTLTKREPSPEEWADIKYGFDMAKKLSGFDIGQTIAIKEKTVISVEAVEGTDDTIARTGTLVEGGFVVVKVARPDQDMRFDVPLVGIETIKTLARSGGKALALEADKTLLMDKDEIIEFADSKDLSIVII
ncbi:MAG: UDP-2,3-diacylglucosamine diphosphatase LpxI [Candidatus Omnitrophica bacterium]|nr:UDP-2,3-diacylglucosamine diphosphatase LpxI [Candidatus Omnitrophota bacterium]MDD5436750.1 UDP-2,3-diacylglucosamine diphosphatase LpxI [Candidatus Omnitrophota bacterium]